MFQHTAARRRLVHDSIASVKITTVSTHSRPKAAGGDWMAQIRLLLFQHTAARRRLARFVEAHHSCAGFNTQPPEGGCCITDDLWLVYKVSTHSRPKAAV